jgi:hypothetical protein
MGAILAQKLPDGAARHCGSDRSEPPSDGTILVKPYEFFGDIYIAENQKSVKIAHDQSRAYAPQDRGLPFRRFDRTVKGADKFFRALCLATR